MKRYALVLASATEVVQTLDLDAPCCNPRNGQCGGCTNCLITQACYAGFGIAEVTLREHEHETLGDAVGRKLREIAV